MNIFLFYWELYYYGDVMIIICEFFLCHTRKTMVGPCQTVKIANYLYFNFMFVSLYLMYLKENRLASTCAGQIPSV